jgi:hypothetical protein
VWFAAFFQQVVLLPGLISVVSFVAEIDRLPLLPVKSKFRQSGLFRPAAQVQNPAKLRITQELWLVIFRR